MAKKQDPAGAMAKARRRIGRARAAANTALDLSGLGLTELPPEIARLTALEWLNLSNNQLTALPPEIAALTALQVLYLNDNQLTALPPEIACLTALRLLILHGNQLTALPPEIASLAALRGLYLNLNQLTALPPEIAALTALEDLVISGNQLPRSYMDALEDGTPNLFALLRSLAEETAPLYEAKLVVTGEGQVGKSWALAALCGDDPREAVGEANTTWGIDLGTLILAHPEEPGLEIRLNTWDFGGQAVYRVTHQFFFSEQAIYLLVWNPRTGPVQCRVREWLRTIALRTGSEVSRGAAEGSIPRARVIMVATHAEEPGGTYNPEYGHDSLDADLQAMIVGAIEIDSDTGFNVRELKDMIARHAAALPDMGSPFNTKWAAAREAALSLRNDHPWITFSRFSEVCSAHGVTDPDDLRTLAGSFMNRLGRAVWYGPPAGEPVDGADALLADTLVLDAVWLSRAFVQVLEDVPTRETGGMLDHRRFPQIWTDHGRPEWRKYTPDEYERIARMMRRFDVALPTRASHGQRSLVPQLVPTVRPSLPWTAAEKAQGQGLVRLACRLDHEAEGLMARFIAATEPYHHYEDGPGLFWQDGVFLRDSFSFANDALVTVEGREKPNVNIVVSGDQPGFLMNELQRTLESVIAFWRGMTSTYHVLCPTMGTDGRFCPGRFKLDTVLRRLAQTPSPRLDCQDCDAKWRPEHLIHGLKAVGQRRAADHQTAFLYHQQKIPCPGTFILRPADPKWHKITSWAHFAGMRFRLTLVSELSGKEVASEEFDFHKEWTKWLGPLTRVASLFLTGLAVPLEGDIAQQLGESAAAMDKLAALPAEEGGTASRFDKGDARQRDQQRAATSAELHQLHQLLQAIGLDPRAHGMELAETRDGRWLWMTLEEAAAHDKPDAQVDPSPL